MMIRQPPSAGPREDPAGGLEAVHPRHSNVHQHHIRPVLEHGGQRLRAVRDLGYDRDPGRAENHPEAAANEGLIVSDHDPPWSAGFAHGPGVVATSADLGQRRRGQ